MRNNNPVIIFDLDETLGYFVELGIFIDCLEEYYNKKIEKEDFFKILDLYPEFIRPYMLSILKYILIKKEENKCYKVMIYTNNQGEKYWVENIKNYFEYKLNNKVFDKIIAAFKVDGKRIELNRTSHNKSVEDLFRCVKLPKNIEICFVDDQYHEQMVDDRVFYIKVEPYVYKIYFDDMIKRYMNSYKFIDENFIKEMNILYKKYNYKVVIKDEEEYKVDKIVSKKLFSHIKNFFNDHNNRKSYKRKIIKNNTIKIRD
jgi:hypothetical protein